MSVLGKLFEPSLMLLKETRAYPNEALFRCTTLEKATGLTYKPQNRLVRPTKDKHSSLLRTFVNYSSKSFITLSPEAIVKKLFTIVIFVIS